MAPQDWDRRIYECRRKKIKALLSLRALMALGGTSLGGKLIKTWTWSGITSIFSITISLFSATCHRISFISFDNSLAAKVLWRYLVKSQSKKGAEKSQLFFDISFICAKRVRKKLCLKLKNRMIWNQLQIWSVFSYAGRSPSMMEIVENSVAVNLTEFLAELAKQYCFLKKVVFIH